MRINVDRKSQQIRVGQKTCQARSPPEIQLKLLKSMSLNSVIESLHARPPLPQRDPLSRSLGCTEYPLPTLKLLKTLS
uniref:SFRICE_011896 n=1 Tax=Spodoptera frugiperda TaxID=7108 RepID=A0A2H1VPU3_SPOFR